MIAALFLSAPVQAQEVQCPKFYPWEDTKLAEVPYRHKGVGIVSKSRISGAGVYAGELSMASEQKGERKPAKGGYDVRFGFGPGERKWFVCSYGRGGDITWWEELAPETTRCTLQVREDGHDPMDARIKCN